MDQPYQPHQPEIRQQSQNQLKNSVNSLHCMKGATLQYVHLSHSLEKTQRHSQIKFYEGYSSYKDEVMRKNTHDKHNFDAVPHQMSGTFPISPIKPQQIEIQKPLICVDQFKVINLERLFKTEGQTQLMVAENGVCKLEETDFKNRVCQSYSMNRIYASINLQSRQAMKRKLTRGMYSIASRKYQPIIDSREIFDDQDLINSVFGHDECRLWRNLMNKYFLRTNKTSNTKRKTILKSEIKVISDEIEGRQMTDKKQRKPRGKRRMRQDVLIKKEEQDHSDMLSQKSKRLNPESYFKKAELNELKKEEDMEEKAISNPRLTQREQIQLQK